MHYAEEHLMAQRRVEVGRVGSTGPTCIFSLQNSNVATTLGLLHFAFAISFTIVERHLRSLTIIRTLLGASRTAYHKSCNLIKPSPSYSDTDDSEPCRIQAKQGHPDECRG